MAGVYRRLGSPGRRFQGTDHSAGYDQPRHRGGRFGGRGRRAFDLLLREDSNRAGSQELKAEIDYIAADVEGYVNDSFSCCAKHFPGYGSNVDTHGDIAIDNRTYEIFQDEDLKVFQAGINNKAPIVLVSHNIVTCKDKKYPAHLQNLSHKIRGSCPSLL